jgi:arylformamidase
MDKQSPVNVAAVTMSAHTGTHADAPFHYNPSGEKMAAVDLAAYLGPCAVIDGRADTPTVTWEQIAGQIDRNPDITRFLVRTFPSFPDDTWPESFRAIDATVIDELAKRGTVLIGTDAPSLDPQSSKEMSAHKAVARHGLAILEGLVLDDVPYDTYELIALPLPFVDLDASPVRAILRK